VLKPKPRLDALVKQARRKGVTAARAAEVAAEMSGAFDVADVSTGWRLAAACELRDRYGDDMRQTFADRAAGRRGLGVGMLFVEELVDLIRARHRPVPRSKQRRHPVGSLTHDIRFALRLLYRQPSFTIVAVVTLALGIGATTAVFTVVNGVLLRPLPYREPDRLVQLFHGRNGRLSNDLLAAELSRRHGRKCSPVQRLTRRRRISSATAIPVQLAGANVTTSFFTVLGATPQRGRAFVEVMGSRRAGGGRRQRRALAPPVRRSARTSSARRCGSMASRSR
jgi:hypothetical protein